MAATARFYLYRTLISVVGVCGLLALWYFNFAARAPLVWHESSVFPSVVRAGDEISVSRTFTVTRPIVVKVTRQLTTGDCATKCTSYGIEDSEFLLEPGTITRIRKHRIPTRIQPGEYRLDFSLQWKNTFGYVHASKHPALYVTVVP